MLLRIIASIWFLLFLVFGISVLVDTPNQIKENARFNIVEFGPSVTFIDSFKKSANILPSVKEYYSWRKQLYLIKYPNPDPKIDSNEPWLWDIQYIRDYLSLGNDLNPIPKNIDWGKNYALGVWNGDFWVYYTSWNNRYNGDDYSWTDGFISLITSFFIGILPLLITLRVQFINKRKVNVTIQ